MKNETTTIDANKTGSRVQLQWLGFLSIMACSAAIVVVDRRRSSTVIATASAAKVPA